MNKKLYIFAVFALLSVLHVQAQPAIPRSLNPSSGGDFAGLLSEGSAWLHESVTFELGVFENDVPTLSSIEKGSEFSWTVISTNDPFPKWTTEGYPEIGWQDDYYGPGGGALVGYFDGQFTLMSNDSPFTPGTQLYIWGYTSKDLKDEPDWILFTNSSWTIPTLGFPAPALTYSLLDPGTETVGGFGSMSRGSGQQLTSVQVIPEPSTYALFLGLGAIGFLGIRRFRK